MPLTTLWSSAESCFHAAVQGWAATPAHFMAHIAPQVHMHALCDEGDKTLEQVAQRGGGCPKLRYIQGQVGWALEQSELAEDVPGHCGSGGWTK